MKKTLSVTMIFLVVLSTLSVSAPKVKAEADYQLTTNPLTDTEPSWSPDGTKIVYHTYAGSWYRHIWVMNNDGTDKTQLTSGNVVDAEPAYSPDGTKIAFSRWGLRGDFMDLMIMDADGSNVQRITFSGIPGKIEGQYNHPRWSKDGNKLLFDYVEGRTAPPYYGRWIGTINVDGTDLEVLDQGSEPKFCYDDTKILFNTHPYFHEDGYCIALMDADGTGRQILTDGPNDRCPDISSITNRIIFTRYTDLYIMNGDGTDIEHIAEGYYGEWSPDGKWIIYVSKKLGNEDIWKMEAYMHAISATVDVDPDTLNLWSKGEWITAYVELPEGYDISDIDVATVKLNNTIATVMHPASVGDEDGDGIPDLMVKFDRAAVAAYILANVESTLLGERRRVTITLTVTGNLGDGTAFEGSDTIRVMCHGGGGIGKHALLA